MSPPPSSPLLSVATARPCLRAWCSSGAALLLAVLVGCASTPAPTTRPATSSAPADIQKDGPSAHPPTDLLRVPDAEPRVENIRSGGPNKPYEVLGEHYTPVARDEPLSESGLASWYGRKFHGRPTASGEIYDMHAMTAAHRTMPIPSYARVRNPANGREVTVRINDRGPFVRERIIDLSYTAALKLGVLAGVAPVQVQRLTHDDIRSGRWRDAKTMWVATATPLEQPAAVASREAPTPAATLAAEPSVPNGASGTALGTASLASPASPTQAPLEMNGDTMAARTAAGRGFWLQFGAFNQRQGALDLRQQLMRDFSWIEPLLAVFNERSSYRVQAGPFASRAEAQHAANRIRLATPTQPLLLHHKAAQGSASN
jgi:rare lipoprotein A